MDGQTDGQTDNCSDFIHRQTKDSLTEQLMGELTDLKTNGLREWQSEGSDDIQQLAAHYNIPHLVGVSNWRYGYGRKLCLIPTTIIIAYRVSECPTPFNSLSS